MCLIWFYDVLCACSDGDVLSMPKMFCCPMYIPFGWEGLSIPTDGCSVHMSIIFINSKLWYAKQDSAPYMVTVILPTFLFRTPELRINKYNGHMQRAPISVYAHILPPNRHAHRTVEHLWHAQQTTPSEHAHRTSQDHIRH